ncbi:MAG: hypothetical protein KIT54_10255 [Phycisphaeraceae bacterium]|nr:hypothetical protein [Phycisphaeraceae bacterium]
MTQGGGRGGESALALLRERVLPALERQAALYDQLAAFGPRQDALIESDQGDGLLRLMGERQTVVDELVEVHRSIEDIRDRWQGFVESLPAGERMALGERLNALKALAARVHEQDARTREQLDSARERVREGLGDLGRARGAMRAYGPTGGALPRHQDREA